MASNRKLTFSENLQINADLVIKGTSYKVDGSNIKSVSLNLEQWGFTGSVSFYVSNHPQKDKLYDSLIKDDLINISINIKYGLTTPKKEKVVPLQLKGIVSDRAYHEVSGSFEEDTLLKSHSVLYRIYTVSFTDSAAFYWKQSFPVKLYVDSTYKSIIIDQKTTDIPVAFDWDALDKEHPQILVSCSDSEDKVSFYDFLLSYVKENNGYFLYDYQKSSYTLSSKRSKDKDPVSRWALQLGWHEVDLPRVTYAKTTFLDAVAPTPSTQILDNPNTIKPLSRDLVGIFTTPQQFKDAATLQKQKDLQVKNSVRWGYSCFPYQISTPNDLVHFNGPDWSKQSYLYNKKLRIDRLRLSALLIEDIETETLNHPNGPYEITYKVDAILDKDTHVSYPEFNTPRYPVKVEALVFSDQGKEGEAVYLYTEDKSTSVKYFQCEIPVWNKLRVRVAHEPDNLNGQIYMPAYKGQKVLLGMYQNHSRIIAYLDWLAYATLPLDGQGNHIVFGKSQADRTTIKHAYTNNIPQLDINRTLQKDTQTISMGDGFIVLHAKEDK